MVIAAGVIVIVVGVAHSVLGERYIIRWLLKQDRLPPTWGGRSFVAGTIRFAWHLTTVLALAIGITLVLFGFGASAATIVAAIGWSMVAAGMLPLLYTRGRHVSWVFFFLAGGLCVAWSLLP